MLVKNNMSRNIDTVWNWVKTPVTPMVWRDAKIDTWNRAGSELMRCRRSNVRVAEATKNTKIMKRGGGFE
jgi:hypothetical protein